MVSFEEKRCAQHLKRKKMSSLILNKVGINLTDVEKLRVSDYVIKHIHPEDRNEIRKHDHFICTYEALGKPHKRTTHRFGVYLNGILVAANAFGTPNNFSNLLGKDYRDNEKQLVRGALSAACTQNVGSSLTKFAIDYISEHTEFKYFTAFSDPLFYELGKIYMATNWIFLGGNFGTRLMLRDPKRPDKGWFSDREARKLSNWKRLCREKLNTKWLPKWNDKGRVLWAEMPIGLEESLRLSCRSYIAKCEQIKPLPKYKWCYIKGKDKRETKNLKKKFAENNPELVQSDGSLGRSYPREEQRGQAIR